MYIDLPRARGRRRGGMGRGGAARARGSTYLLVLPEVAGKGVIILGIGVGVAASAVMPIFFSLKDL